MNCECSVFSGKRHLQSWGRGQGRHPHCQRLGQ
jgi:hypothetical protein